MASESITGANGGSAITIGNDGPGGEGASAMFQAMRIGNRVNGQELRPGANANCTGSPVLLLHHLHLHLHLHLPELLPPSLPPTITITIAPAFLPRRALPPRINHPTTTSSPDTTFTLDPAVYFIASRGPSIWPGECQWLPTSSPWTSLLFIFHFGFFSLYPCCPRASS